MVVRRLGHREAHRHKIEKRVLELDALALEIRTDMEDQLELAHVEVVALEQRLVDPAVGIRVAGEQMMGMIAMQKSDLKGAENYIRSALRKGLPDKENEAAAYLQMCSIMMTKREFRAAKDFFRKAKALKPTTPQIVDQIKQIEKYIARIPG